MACTVHQRQPCATKSERLALPAGRQLPHRLGCRLSERLKVPGGRSQPRLRCGDVASLPPGSALPSLRFLR